jgi:hypothetical protein
MPKLVAGLGDHDATFSFKLVDEAREAAQTSRAADME